MLFLLLVNSICVYECMFYKLYHTRTSWTIAAHINMFDQVMSIHSDVKLYICTLFAQPVNRKHIINNRVMHRLLFVMQLNVRTFTL